MPYYYYKHYQFAAALTFIFGVALWAWSPSLSGQVFVLLIFGGLIGLPHGLTDFALLKRCGMRLLPQIKNAKITFSLGVLAYLGLMGLFLLLWIFAPLTALLVFLGIAGYHFGTQDAQAYFLSQWQFWLFAFTRGIMVIALPLILHNQTAEMFNAMIGLDFFYTPDVRKTGFLILILAFLLPLLALKNSRLFGEQCLLLLIYLTLPPLLSFTLYFCLWHTPRHYIEEREIVQKFVLDRISLMRLIAIFSLFVGLAFMGCLSLAPLGLSLGQQTAAFFFIVVSCLTFSHVIFSQKAI